MDISPEKESTSVKGCCYRRNVCNHHVFTFLIAHGNRSGCTLNAIDGILWSGHYAAGNSIRILDYTGRPSPLAISKMEKQFTVLDELGRIETFAQRHFCQTGFDIYFEGERKNAFLER